MKETGSGTTAAGDVADNDAGRDEHAGDNPILKGTRIGSVVETSAGGRLRITGGGEKDGEPVVDGVALRAGAHDPADVVGTNVWVHESEIVRVIER